MFKPTKPQHRPQCKGCPHYRPSKYTPDKGWCKYTTYYQSERCTDARMGKL